MAHNMGTPAQAPDPREARLPNWAQNMLNALRRSLTDALNAAEEARLATSPIESNAIVERFEHGPIGLGDATVTFRVKGEAWYQVISVRAEHGKLVVNGGSGIRIQPTAYNTIEITLSD